MDDLYGKHVAPPALSGSIPRSSLTSYFPAETSSMTSRHVWNSNDLRGASADYAPKDVLSSHARGYNFGDSNGIGGHRDPGLNGLMDGGNIRGYPSMENLNVIGRRQDVAAGVSPAILDVNNGRPSSSRKVDGPPVATGESNLLFVDGLPTDCTRREVGHLFRPFIGFKDIRVVHKEPRRSVDKARVLCFVEFDDAGCALTALKALQGYKFDDRKPESPVLRIHFAHFPFHLPSDHSTEQPGIP